MRKNRLVAFFAGIAVTAATLVGLGGTPAVAAAPVAPPAMAAAAAPSSDVVAPPLAVPKLPKKKGHQPKGVKAKKSLPGASASGGISTFAACSTPCFYYAGARRDDAVTPTDGMAVNMGVYKPVKAAVDFHSIGEISMQKGVGNLMQGVEVGWTVDPVVNAGCTPNPACLADPHVFVFRWNNGVGACYNGCGFVDYAPTTLDAGDSVASMIGTQHWARIQYSGGNWWVMFDNQWIGYYPGSLWSGSFTNSTYQQAFGEIATSDTTTNGDMGNGVLATNLVGARMGSLNKVVGGVASLATYTSNYATVPAKWSFAFLTGSTSSFNYGGPG